VPVVTDAAGTTPLANCKSVAANLNHTLFLTTDGSIYAAGRNGCESAPLVPTPLIASVGTHPHAGIPVGVCVQTVAWLNPRRPHQCPPPPSLTDSELGLGTASVTNYAAQVTPDRVANKVAIDICAGKRHSCAVFADNTVRLWPGAPLVCDLQVCQPGD
jgi:alpha-tubulin suppressor-like RCC1 family protein